MREHLNILVEYIELFEKSDEKLTLSKSFDFDVIGLPYEMNVFGLSGSFSPWKTDYKFSLMTEVNSNYYHPY